MFLFPSATAGSTGRSYISNNRMARLVYLTNLAGEAIGFWRLIFRLPISGRRLRGKSDSPLTPDFLTIKAILMEPLKVIKINSTGPLVESWQFFLIGQGLFAGVADGNFDANTKAASIEFQRKHNLQPDGVVGNKSFGVAMQLGFEGTTDDRTDNSGADFPFPPAFAPLIGNTERQSIFGKFAFKSKPVPGNPENIQITDDWEKNNI